MKMLRLLSLLLPALSALSCAQGTPAPYGALPTPAQVAWQRMEMNMFVHFGPNTFSGKEWGDGTEPEDMFHPTALDCRQWARTARDAGFRGIILTAKHHDGFCLWPNPESAHTVAQSRWRDGRGDVLRELSDACREYGLKFGVYISPWDRNDPRFGSPAYNDAFVKTLESVLDGRYAPDNRILSPVTGVLSEVSKATGDTVTKGDTLMKVIPDSSFQVQFEVPEKQAELEPVPDEAADPV